MQPVIGDPSKLLSPVPIASATPVNGSTPSSSPTRSSSASPTEPKLPASDPVLFPKNDPSPSKASEMDYSQTFRGNEVDSRVRILEQPEPTYTEMARKNRAAGVVVLRAVFSSAGTVTNIQVVSGLADGLSEQAISAAKRIKFVPAMKNGHPVSMWMELQYNFNLY